LLLFLLNVYLIFLGCTFKPEINKNSKILDKRNKSFMEKTLNELRNTETENSYGFLINNDNIFNFGMKNILNKFK
jgi:hypothetical protein